MAGEKTLTFKVSGDPQGIVAFEQAIVGALKRITNAAVDMNKALKGVPLNAGNPGAPPPPGTSPSTSGGPAASVNGIGASAGAAVAAAVNNNKNLLAGLAKASKDTLANMGDIVSRELDKERKALADLDRQLEKVNSRHKEHIANMQAMKSAGSAAGSEFAVAEGAISFSDKQVKKVVGQRGEQNARIDELEKMLAEVSPSDPGKGSIWTRDLGSMKGMMRGAAWGYAALNTVGGIAQEMTARPFDTLNAEAASASIANIGVATAKGDFRYALALNQMNDPGKRGDMGALAESADFQKVLSVISGIKSTAALDPASGFFGATRGLEMADPNTKKMMVQMLQKQMESNPEYFAKLETGIGQASNDISFTRQVGNYRDFLNMVEGGRTMHYDTAAVESAFNSVRGIGGRNAGVRGFGAVLHAVTGGMDMGAAGNIVGSSVATGHDGSLLSGLVSSKSDIVVAERIGTAIASSLMQAGTGGPGGMGLAGMLLNGTGGVNGMQIAQQNIAGIGAQQRILGGGLDAYQQGANILSALNVMPNGSISQLKYLSSGLDMATVASVLAPGGKVTDEMKALGITKDMVREQYKGSMSSVMDRVTSDDADQSPMAKALREVETKYGGDIQKFLQANPNKVSAIAAFGKTRLGMTTEESQGWARNQAGLGKSIGSGGGIVDPAEGLAVTGVIDTQNRWSQAARKAVSTPDGMGADIKGVASAAATIHEETGKLGMLTTNAERAATGLGILANVIAEAIVRIQQGKGADKGTTSASYSSQMSKVDAAKAQAEALERKDNEERLEAYGNMSMP
jgi:hypothetical protein